MTAAMALERASVRLSGRPALEDVSLTLEAGEVVGLVGANGAGKTTLLRAALGLVRLERGQAFLAGRPVAALSEPVRAALAGYLPQERRVAWNMPAWRVASLGAPLAAPAESHRRALAALDELGLAGFAERGVRDMSGGERARVLIARLLVTAAPLLVVDEPTAGLDPDAAFRVLEVLRARALAGAAVITTLHDLTLAARACDRLAVLKSGRLLAVGPPAEVLTSDVLAQAFTLEGGLTQTPTGVVLAVRRAAH